MNRGEEDYLKVIFHLIEQDSYKGKDIQYISNNRLSESLGHTLQTVNEMVKKLDQKELLIYVPYKGSKLTKKGLELSLRLTRVHRLWELFLVEKLDYSWHEVHKDAEELEHATSTKLEKRLYKFLGEPQYCPHGNVIPDFQGHASKRKVISLLDGKLNKEYILKKVSDNQELLIYLNKKNIELGNVFFIKEKDEFSSFINIVKDGVEIIIGYNAAKEIFVEEI